MDQIDFVIEHLDDELFPWSKLEYEHMIAAINTTASPQARLVFNRLPAYWGETPPPRVHFEAESFLSKGIDTSTVCVLDPMAEQELVPSDAAKIRHFVFGGVLGNHPPDGRTKRELSDPLTGCITRHLGPRQMTTDAALVTSVAVLLGYARGPLAGPPRPLSAMRYADDVVFVISPPPPSGHFSRSAKDPSQPDTVASSPTPPPPPASKSAADEVVEMPFRYIAVSPSSFKDPAVPSSTHGGPLRTDGGEGGGAAGRNSLTAKATDGEDARYPTLHPLPECGIPRRMRVRHSVSVDGCVIGVEDSGAKVVVVMAQGMFDLWREEADDELEF